MLEMFVIQHTSTLILIEVYLNSQFYQQADGAAMGRLASSTTAETYLQAYERTAITTTLHPPKVWE